MAETWETVSFIVSGVFSFLAIILSFYLIIQHLRNWTVPGHQRHIVRLLLMVPVYAIDSWLSVRFKSASLYLDVARDCYEAYALYQFFSLLVAYIEDDKPGTISGILAGKDKRKHPCPLCCLPPVTPGPHFLIIIKQCILQYVIIKPLMSAAAAVLQIIGVYHEGSFDPTHGYLYVTVIVNTSVTISMYCLVLFYLVAKDELAPYRPVGKFACIKAILFFSFWQSVAIGVLSYLKVIPPIGEWSQHEVATALNDFIICIEMFLLAIVHPYVFPYQEYMANENGERRKINSTKEALKMIHEPVKNFGHVVDHSDLLTDIVGSYHPKKVAHAKAELQGLEKEIADENETVEDTEENIGGVSFFRL